MTDLDRVPRRRRGHHLEQVDGENLLFGRAKAKAYFLNDSASAIWNLCDGTRTIGDIVEILVGAYPDVAFQIKGDVVQIVEHLVSEGVLAINDPPAPGSA